MNTDIQLTHRVSQVTFGLYTLFCIVNITVGYFTFFQLLLVLVLLISLYGFDKEKKEDTKEKLYEDFVKKSVHYRILYSFLLTCLLVTASFLQWGFLIWVNRIVAGVFPLIVDYMRYKSEIELFKEITK